MSAPPARMDNGSNEPKGRWMSPCGDLHAPCSASFSSMINLTKQHRNHAKKVIEKRPLFGSKLEPYLELKVDDFNNLPVLTSPGHLKNQFCGDSADNQCSFKQAADITLYKVSAKLQKLAVFFELIINEEKPEVKDERNLQKDFEESQDNLMSSLCEVQLMMKDRQLDITYETRNIVPKNLTNAKDVTERTTRGAIVFSDYFNTLDIMIKAFSNLDSQSSAKWPCL